MKTLLIIMLFFATSVQAQDSTLIKLKARIIQLEKQIKVLNEIVLPSFINPKNRMDAGYSYGLNSVLPLRLDSTLIKYKP